jgi:hypothetical protein
VTSDAQLAACKKRLKEIERAEAALKRAKTRLRRAERDVSKWRKRIADLIYERETVIQHPLFPAEIALVQRDSDAAA